MKYLFTLSFLFILVFGYSQSYLGSIDEAYQFKVEKINDVASTPRSNPDTPTQLDGFPLSFSRDPNSNNLRNLTLEDINSDGVQDLLFAADNILMAYANQTVLWQKAMIGTGIYPPSVADIDNDGDMEIVQVTGGNGKKGRIYALDHLGNNLPGFPKSYDDNWIITTAALSDLDNDGQLEIIFVERNPPNGNIHILDNKGERWSDNWPIRIPGTPAITPSIGDIDNDGIKEIVVSSTTVLYVFNLDGQLEEGWPVDNPDTKFSFQSPILADLDGDNDLEIVGAAHGNIPQFYILNHDGTDYKAWPFFVPERTWSFSTPSLIKGTNGYEILMSRPRPNSSLVDDRIYNWDEAGNLLSGFPLESESGCHGVLSVANVDEDEDMEIIFSSNILEDGHGFIHAMNTDGSGEVAGFPLRPKGWTMMNGAALGDIDGDGQLDLSALSYTTNLGEAPDSVFVNVYNLERTFNPEEILWTTYKGSNSRDGNLDESVVSSIYAPNIEGLSLEVLPNPIYEKGSVKMKVTDKMKLTGNLITINGQFSKKLFQNNFEKGEYNFDLTALIPGSYLLVVNDTKNRIISKKIIIQNK